MPEFEDTRSTLTAKAAEVADQRRRLFSEEEKLRRTKRRRKSLKRRPETNANAISEIEHQIAELEREISGLKREELASRLDFEGNFERFAPFLDPRENISRLDDRYPILLFPLSIETRFKTGARGGNELWMRVYPDAISVAGFEDNLTETEWRNARTYWAHRWAGGDEEDVHRAAWQAIVKSHGSGRARWLIDQVAPQNPEDMPEHVEGEHRLVVILDQPLAQAERDAIAAYWEAILVAPRDATVTSDAMTTLAAIVGNDRATTIVETMRPHNLEALLAAGPQTGSIRSVFLVIAGKDAFELQEQAWRHPAKASGLPDRFVVLGFEGEEQTLVHLGNPVPAELQVGPDPAADETDQLKADGEDLSIPDAMAWMTDFDAAIAKGMGFRIPLSDRQAKHGFDRLFVVGVRMGMDAGDGAAHLESMFADHVRSRKGCAILAQGTPTNNVEDEASGYSWREEADVSFDHYFKQEHADDPDDWRSRKDGRRLADALGLNPDALKKLPNYFACDQAEARAMNEALWPATLGYYMDEMVDTVFEDDDIDWMRGHFTRHVLGRGHLPALRVGRQPYGIVTAAPFSRLQWFDKRAALTGSRKSRFVNDHRRLVQLYTLLKKAEPVWADLAATRQPLGTKSDDPFQQLADAIGLHPASVDYYQRIAETAEQLFNRMKMSGLIGAFLSALIAAGHVAQGRQTLADLGHVADDDQALPAILGKLFLRDAYQLKGPVIDDVPLSEIDPLRIYHDDGGNYIDALIAAAGNSHDALRRQEGFLDGRRPRALLYLLMRHALDLSFVERAVRLHVDAGLIEPQLARAARRVPTFFQVSEQASDQESPWQYLYRAEPLITGDGNTDVGRFISKTIMTGNSYLKTQLEAMQRLASLPTARLERLFADHVDCCSYRLDAWWMSLAAAQVETMRAAQPAPAREDDRGDVIKPEAATGRGLYLGAFGWVENLRPENKALSPARLDDDLHSVFNRQDELPVSTDATNQGFVHAPSLDQATTAAILRNGHMAHRSNQQPDALAVNLSSARVRDALGLIEGIRNGQSLSALLGYRFERGLHDADELFLDSIFLELRKQFPLRGNKIKSTLADPAASEAIEARNVVDGLALVRWVEDRSGADRNYPFGLGDKLPTLSAAARAAVDREVERLIDMNDAVADVAMSEGVHQLVKGNYDRAAANLDSYAKGYFPPLPDVVRTPRNGHVLTHRVAIHMPVGLDPAAAANITPRAKGEPAINSWLADHLPPLSDIICQVDWFDHASDTARSETVSMAQLGFAPIDLLFMLRDASGQAMQALDQEVLFHVIDTHAPRPDAEIKIRYRVEQDPKTQFSIFEIAPLIRDYEALLLASRPLRATDAQLPNESSRSDDVKEFIDERKVDALTSEMQALQVQLSPFVTAMETAIDAAADDTALKNLAIANVDGWIDQFAPIARALARFGLAEASFAFAYDLKAERYRALIERIAQYRTDWTDRRDRFDVAMTEYAALPAATGNEEKMAFLLQSALLLTHRVIVPPSADPDDLRDLLVATHRPPLVTATGALDGLLPPGHEVGQLHDNLAGFEPVILGLDLNPLDLAPTASGLASLARALADKARALLDDVDTRLASAATLRAEAAALAPAARIKLLTKAAQQLTSEDFRILPEFDLSDPALAEWQAAQADSELLLTYLKTEKLVDFPVTDWLHGCARVREKMGHLERAGLVAEAFGLDPLELRPIQLPYRLDDRWIGLEFPEFESDGTTPFAINEDKLLYTALFADAAAASTRRQSGFLFEEWTEVLPTLTQTTGLAFHYDRPNCEAPNSLLLALPARIDGSWDWDDIVDALHETLDMAKKRTVEPGQLAETQFAAFLPAIITSVTRRPLFQALNLAENNAGILAKKVVLP